MIIGVPAEIKPGEHRVGLVPGSVKGVCLHGHQVVVQAGAGLGIGFTDEDYVACGGEILSDAKTVFDRAEMIVKVKEPQGVECAMLREDQLLFTYLHLAPDSAQAEGLMNSGCTAVAYETVTAQWGRLPLLAPMSEVAGRLSVQMGAFCLEKQQGGSGILLSGVLGEATGRVVVVGGVVGSNAARMAMGREAEVFILDASIKRLQELDTQFGGKLHTIYSTASSLEEYALSADCVVSAVLVPGASAPKLVTRDMLKRMRPGSVVVDVAIDQGGCFETSRATTHAEPTSVEEGIMHYRVANMPGAVPRTAAFALNHATLSYVITLANKGYRQAMRDDQYLCEGLNVANGRTTHPAVADALEKDYWPIEEVIN